ncbi:hypothetical protein [Salinarimonas sp.]|uniref:hypothetical protein n=1 Tax=Salinarimonas sp. TaxID=2766526 RepID=UPI0032D92D56
MKRWLGRYLLSPEVQQSTLGAALRSVVKSTKNVYKYNPWFLLDSQAVERPHYAYCMLNASVLARKLGLGTISAIEFGVAGGNGLAFMSRFAREVKRATGVAVECYGFDTGRGMPDPKGPQDLPYWFRSSQYKMDEDVLREKVPDATLVIGDVRDTVKSFLEDYKPAPIGVIFNDMDYLSSTSDSFYLFENRNNGIEHFLPRIFMYFDDIIGSSVEMYGPFNGQLAAINDFNSRSADAKIHLNQNLLPQAHLRYRYQIYYAHLFDHPRYCEYLGDEQQKTIMSALAFRE